MRKPIQVNFKTYTFNFLCNILFKHHFWLISLFAFGNFSCISFK